MNSATAFVTPAMATAKPSVWRRIRVDILLLTVWLIMLGVALYVVSLGPDADIRPSMLGFPDFNASIVKMFGQARALLMAVRMTEVL